MTIKCSECNIEKERNRTNFHRLVIHGKETFHSKCKECRKKEKIDLNWKNGKLLCKLCNSFLEEECFDINIKTGSEYRNHKESRCKKCKTKQSKKLRSSLNGDSLVDRILKERWLGAKDRAKRNNIQFTILEEDIKEMLVKQNYKCAISKIDLTFFLGKGRIMTNVSIDRISSNEGYTKENIQLVCMAVNQMKSDLTIDELLLFCKAIVDNN